jgi:hypothetical protein
MAFSQVVTSASLHFVKISLQFPKLQGETGSMGAASTTMQSDANRRFLFMTIDMDYPGIGFIRVSNRSVVEALAAMN